jgi:hypothetical protein
LFLYSRIRIWEIKDKGVGRRGEGEEGVGRYVGRESRFFSSIRENSISGYPRDSDRTAQKSIRNSNTMILVLLFPPLGLGAILNPGLFMLRIYD